MPKLFLSILMALCFKLSFGQAMVGKAEYQKSQQPAAIIELPYSSDLVEAAIKDFLTKKGARSSQSKGYLAFKKVQLALSDPSPSDVYFKVDRKSKKDNNTSVVSMIVAKQDENVATRSSEDSSGMDQAVSFLNEIGPSINSYSIEVDMKGQEEAVKKAEKKYNSLVDDGKDLESKKRNIEDKIQDNIKDQDKQKAELDKQKQILETITARKKA